MRLGIALVPLLAGWTALSSAQRGPASHSDALVRKGRELFTRVWTVNDGLGPLVNARRCAGCHAGPKTGGSGTHERSFVSVMPALPDGSGGRVFRRLRISTTGAIDEELPPMSAALRRASSLLGSGLLESIPADEISAGAADLGTLGRIPQGRYGWKGHLRNIEEATAAAFANELGMSSAMFAEPAGPPAELSPSQITSVAAFIRSLPPITGGTPLSDQSGRQLFNRLGCATCHRPSFPSLDQQKAFPYTDLLLHDMGPMLADGIAQGFASGSDFRTPPLWGIAKTGPPYLHDGRARTLHDAITAHGGEAEESAAAYQKLREVDRAAVLAFLRSL